jgi:putative intracellular protein transport protein USO1
MTTEEKEKFNEEQSSNSDLEKENKSSFFGRLKTQVSNLKTKVEKLAFEEFEDDDANHEDEEELNNEVKKTTDKKEVIENKHITDNKEINIGKQSIEDKQIDNNKQVTNHEPEIKEVYKEDDVQIEDEELIQKQKEAKQRAIQLEEERKQFELTQQKIAEKQKRRAAEREEEERLERQRIEKEKAEKLEQERLERERIAREKELERQRIEKEKAEKREQERLERERIAREKELERQRIEKEKAEKREQERLERERIAHEKKLEQERIEREQAEKRRREFEEREKAQKLADEKKKIELLEKENQKREHENNLLHLQNSLLITEDKIEDQKILLNRLKRRKEDEENIKPVKEKLDSLIAEKQQLNKDISAEKKQIEKIQKQLDLEQKLAGFRKEINSIKKEVVNEDETIFKVKDSNNKLQNIFVAAFTGIKATIWKKVFKKDVENYDNIKKTGSNIKVKIATSLILATLLSIFFLITLKFVSSAQEHYVSFDDLQTTQVDSTEEMKKQKEAEEKAKILEAQEKANAARIDSEAQDEEITAKLAGTFVSYSFDVNREVTVNKKIHSFKSANWSDTGDVIEAGTKLKVDKLVSPAGYMMYRISSGEHSGKYITANEKFVRVDKKEDQLSNPISRPVAIKLLASQNIYSDEELSKVRVTMSNGAVLNINGYGISKNNRLIYFISDGSYVPVNPIRITEVNRESANSKDINKENNNSSNNQKNSTTQNTTQKKNN